MIQVTIHGDTLAAIAKQASELASSLANHAPVAAAPKAAPAPTPPPAAAPKTASHAQKKTMSAQEFAAHTSSLTASTTPAMPKGEVTIASLREQGRQLIKAGKSAEFKAALTSVGADSITTLDPSKYNDLSVALAAILTPAEAPEGDGL